MHNSYRDNRDNEFHYRDIRIFIIAQPYHYVFVSQHGLVLIFKISEKWGAIAP